MYSREDATQVGAPSLADERRYEYKKLMMRAIADVCTFHVLNREFVSFESFIY